MLKSSTKLRILSKLHQSHAIYAPRTVLSRTLIAQSTPGLRLFSRLEDILSTTSRHRSLAVHMTMRDRLIADGGLSGVINRFRPDLKEFEALYKILHQQPELSTQEVSTAATAASHLRSLEFHVHDKIGGTGLVGVLENGPGPIVLLRSEMDALPILEQTGLPYASSKHMTDTDGEDKPVMHACGHDMHIACLLAASSLLAAAKEHWKGTLISLFQPNEERGGGARAMLEDGLYSKNLIPEPHVVLGQHVVNIRAGYVATRAGNALAGKTVFEVRIPGRGGHGSAPQDCVDPVVIACYIVIRLQSIISRELDPNKMALITCGSIHAGDAPNVIPDFATLKVDIRAYEPSVLAQVIGAFKRIVKAECEASVTPEPPTIKEIECVPPLVSTPEVVDALNESFKDHFDKRVEVMKIDTAADDFSLLAPNNIPYAYWNFGSEDPERWEKAERDGKLNELPGNHSAFYAPMIEPTLKAGTDAMAIAALTFLEVRE